MKYKYTLAKLAGIMMMFSLCNEVQAQLISVKTNALMWGNLTPNLSVELVTSGKTSLEFTGFYSPDKTPMKTNMQGAQAELRYWVSGRPMNRLFLGLGVSGLRYEMYAGNEYRHLGDAAGPGLACGYALPLGKHWNIEFAAGVGILWYREKKYSKDIDITGKPYNKSGKSIMPTKLSVACAYVF